MEHHHFHWLEKLQVQIMTVLGLLGVYFLAWPIVRPDDPLSPMTFLPLGGYGGAAGFAVVFCVLVALCAVATVKVRPVGALLSATLSAGGVTLRSPQIRALLWARQGDMGRLYGQLMIEVATMAVLAAAAALIVLLVRRLARTINPNWSWKDPMADESDQRPAAAVMLVRCAACVVLAAVIATVILAVTMRSADRGQIIFAMLLSFTVGVFVAHQVFPQPYALSVWVLPMVIAAFFYAVGWAHARSDVGAAWVDVNMLFRALPVDWLTAGGGGALLGFWISQRVYEFRHVHLQHEPGEK